MLHSFAMAAPHLLLDRVRATPRQRAWLLWLVLVLLPLAQWAATVHAVSHTRADLEAASTAPHKAIAHLADCDLCLTSAALGAGALPAAALPMQTPGHRPPHPVALAQAAPRAFTELPYRSRAPPAFLL